MRPLAHAAGSIQGLDHLLEQARRHGHVVERALGGAEPLAELLERRWIRVVADDVREPRAELVDEATGAHAGLLRALAHARPEALEIQIASRHTDHGDVEATSLEQPGQRREDLLEGEIAGDTEDDERVRGAHAGVSACPPNALRRAEISLSANSCSPREAKRS